jgi:hypothetical protein
MLRGHMIIIEAFERWRQPRTTALHSTNREKFAVTRHGLPQFPAAAPSLRPAIKFAPSVVSDAPKPLLPAIPTGNAIRPSDNSDRSHHVPRLPLPVVTSPRSAENRNTHRPSSAARGFVPRRLSYAWRRPKLFTEGERRLPTAGRAEQTFTSAVPNGSTRPNAADARNSCAAWCGRWRSGKGAPWRRREFRSLG